MEWLIQVAQQYGLFVALVVYVLWDSRRRELESIKREYKYIDVINQLAASFKVIQKDVEDIKNKLWGADKR